MPRLTRWLPVLLVLLAAACGGSSDARQSVSQTSTDGNQTASAPVCPAAWKPGWQKLANRIDAPVYCPSWMPDPLTGEIGGPWQAMYSVLKDRSYLVGFLWYETNVAETHVNFRGYPGRTAVPTCNGKPCFNDPGVKKTLAGLDIQVYNVNRGADTWHVLYAWHTDGSLYAVSQHVVPDFGISYGQVTANLDRIVRGLVRIDPHQS
jgi:hypothetical protein